MCVCACVCDSRLIVDMIILLLFEHQLGYLGGVCGVVSHGNRIPWQLGETLLAVDVSREGQCNVCVCVLRCADLF